MKHIKKSLLISIFLPIAISACFSEPKKYDCVIRTYSGDVYYSDKSDIVEKDNKISFVDKLTGKKSSTYQYSIHCKD